MKKKKIILEKKGKNKMKKKHVGKVKVKFSTSSILKKNSKKIILKIKHVGKHCGKTKTMWGNIVTIHSVLKKKSTKQNSQLTQYKKKSIKTILEKKNHKKKLCRETL